MLLHVISNYDIQKMLLCVASIDCKAASYLLQARVQEFVRGGAQNLKAFFFCFLIFQGGGPAPKIAEKRIFSTKKVAKYR